MEVIPITIPAIAGVMKWICDFMSESMSASRSFSLSFTLLISFMYLATPSRACAAIFGPLRMLSISTFIELLITSDGK